MSSTIKQAILSLKIRIADAYTAIVEKGGTLPATQDSANLPSAIASIPSGGGSTGLFDVLNSELDWPSAQVSALNTQRDTDIAYSKSVKSQTSWRNDTQLVYAPYIKPTSLFETFYGCTNIKYIPQIDCSNIPNESGQKFSSAFRGIEHCDEIYLYGLNQTVTSEYQTSMCFYNSKFYKITLLGNVASFVCGSNTFYGCTNLTTLILGDCTGATSFSLQLNGYGGAYHTIKNIEVSKLPNCSMSNAFLRATNLTHESLMNIINALPTTTNGYTCTLNATNLAKLTEAEKQIATDKGWTLN